MVEAMRTIIRVKHYSYTTERTYLDWVSRLFDYLGETGQSPSPETVRINEDRIKDFNAYLATRKNVAASTQNQAFGALLFLRREVTIGQGETSLTVFESVATPRITDFPGSPGDGVAAWYDPGRYWSAT